MKSSISKMVQKKVRMFNIKKPEKYTIETSALHQKRNNQQQNEYVKFAYSRSPFAMRPTWDCMKNSFIALTNRITWARRIFQQFSRNSLMALKLKWKRFCPQSFEIKSNLWQRYFCGIYIESEKYQIECL